MENIVKNRVVKATKILSLKNVPSPSPKIRTTTIVDAETGEIIKDVTSTVVSKNGSGFVISYTEKLVEFVTKVESPSVLRVFLLLAHRQGFGVNGIYGYRCSKKYLREVLRVNRKTIYEALKWLEDNFLVVENRFDGQTEFMVNPEYITIGSDKSARMREWSLRWEMYFKAKKRK